MKKQQEDYIIDSGFSKVTRIMWSHSHKSLSSNVHIHIYIYFTSTYFIRSMMEDYWTHILYM